ncbi:MAG: hypothetical protein AOA66_1263 [Candidatus Bathyarchaeota archaeon BA2]|nr:MAG: hypothetical protein AOA66_1263 [Candidatus Bathyarchaeota archaeon BA2]
MTPDLAQIPYSTILILCLSALMALITSIINRRVTSPEQREKLKALQHQITALKREKDDNLKKAKSTGDKKLLKKARKQEKQILQLSSQMASLSFRQMKTFPIFIIIFLVFWTLLTGRIDFLVIHLEFFKSPFNAGLTVANLPWVDGVLQLPLIWWYILCSFASGTLFSRAFGLMGAIE